MRLVGASDALVRWPFIFEGLLIGALAAAASLGILAVAAGPLGQLANATAVRVRSASPGSWPRRSP
jgi:cell division protein FtsX